MKWTALLSTLSLLPSTLAASSTYATFIYNGTGSTSSNAFIWSINAVKSTGDIYFHMSAPASGSWAAVGFGNQMAGTLMMIAYPSANGSGITISPRIATGHAEPTYAPETVVEQRFDTNLTTPNYINQTSNIMYIDGVCKKCASWNGGQIDMSSTAQPFIFAVGPGEDMNSDSLAAPLKRHAFYGAFTMNMQMATSASNGSVPVPVNGVYTAFNSGAATSTHNDNDFAPGAHGGLMILSFLLIFPFGSILLRIFDKVILHSIVQCIGTFFVLVSFGLGIYVSGQYNRSNKFQSAHQIIGLLLVVGLLAQLGLGIVGHRIFKKSGQPAKLSKVHLFLGPVLIILAAVNGGLGWNLAQSGWMITRYVIIVIAIFIVFTPLRIVAHMCMRRRQRTRAAAAGQAVTGPPGGDYQRPEFVPKQPYSQAVPLQTFHSTDSVPQYYDQAHQPRTMV